MRILTFCGESGSGKDTLTDYLLRFAPELMGWGPEDSRRFFVRYAFANLAKDTCSQILGIDRICFEGARKDQPSRFTKKELVSLYPVGTTFYDEVLTHREVLCLWAEYMRQIDSQCWVRPVFKKIADDGPEWAIISDGRRVDEFRTAKCRGGKLIRLSGWPVERHPYYQGDDLNVYKHYDETINTKQLGIFESKRRLTQILLEWGWVTAMPEFLRHPQWPLSAA